MGKATVVSGGANGRYMVRVDYGQAAKTARLAAIDKRLTELDGLVDAALADLNLQEIIAATALAAVEAAVVAYVAAAQIGPKELEAAAKAHADALAAANAQMLLVAPLKLTWQALKNEQAQLQKDRAKWDAMVVVETVEAWCADLTTSATGQVATLEIPGENKLILVAPAAPAPVDGDGVLTAREVQSPAQVFFNAAVLPGWQKFKPTYRRGTITAVLTEIDAADVLLDATDKSSAQKLVINPTPTLSAVPVQYMSCNASAFSVGDRCVVKFIDRDWSKPKIVGFVDNPKNCPIYMETGQLEWAAVTPLDPARMDPAKWHFLDIGTGSGYLGYAKASDGAQDNYPALAEEASSRAVGPRRVRRTAAFTEEQNAAADAADAAMRLADEAKTVRKKTVAGLFPPSVFTGKMRLFMQAQYGALQELFALNVDILGESVLLFYEQGGERLQLGFWGHLTPGIFTAPDGTYWLINISAGATVRSYPIRHSSAVQALVEKLKTGGLSDDERTKIEAYVFAYSTIDLTAARLLGAVPAAIGAPMAYGWKFSRSGAKAGIILHEGLNPGTTTERWKSRTVMLDFSYSSGVVSMSSEVTDNGEWIDGWGSHILWVPPDERSTAPLSMFSIKANGGAVAASFNFSGVPIYGYFKGEVWTQATVTYSALTGFPIYRQGDAGITYDASIDLNTPSRYQYGAYIATSPWSYWSETISSGASMDLAFDGGLYQGEELGGSFGFLSSFTSAGGAEIAPYMNYFVSTLPGGAPPNGLLPTGYPDDISPDTFPLSGNYVGSKLSAITRDQWTLTGSKIKAWAFVVPAGDCEAAYVATHEYLVPTSVAHTTDVMTARVATLVAYSVSGARFEWAPWQRLDSPPGWFGDAGTVITTTDSVPPAENEVFVYCYNTELSGTSGTPGGSYAPLFTVDVSYQYYARGMYTYTSYGGRYVMSEMGTAVPPSVSYSERFVGWA